MPQFTLQLVDQSRVEKHVLKLFNRQKHQQVELQMLLSQTNKTNELFQ